MPPKTPFLTTPTSCTGRGTSHHNVDCAGNCKPYVTSSTRALWLSKRRYDARHNAVLAEIAQFVHGHLRSCDWGKDYNMTVDLPTREYRPPHHLCPTDLKPDLVIWNDAKHSAFLIEPTCPFEENFVDAAIRKKARYHNLANTAKSDGVQCTIWPVQVGSRGMVDRDSFSALVMFLNSPRSSVADLYCSMSGLALQESYTVWCSRNRLSDSSCT